ncbi:formate/nitrite transporter family protein (plasmid) [Skermanella mucosa]|uniref:formate/nitrite transporter family protein n=1 Tax=Skermanella mucosa TaxID=1789672 RepID=UPI00192AC933|nr:formate/nitrite transporter family protein [Skermanella mucosa]UEM25031.1 formate/nitrite transporter family protein [Skermanella mucosa]
MEFGHRDGRAEPRRIDALLPKEMAKRAERIGAEKAEQDSLSLLVLGILAGAFVAFGATFAAAVTAGADAASSPGLVKLAGGVTFSLAYVLAIVGGAELFTTNNLMVMAWAHGRLTTVRLLRAWGIVFVGNFIGTVSTATLLILAGQHAQMEGSVGAGLLGTAAQIGGLSPSDGFVLGILGNTLLCLGVWLTYSARTTTDRIMALMLPVTAFYVLDFEHAIAVMFYLPSAVLIDLFAQPDFWILIDRQPADITLSSFLRVLASVTAGNIVGGGMLVALVYWFVYLRSGRF